MKEHDAFLKSSLKIIWERRDFSRPKAKVIRIGKPFYPDCSGKFFASTPGVRAVKSRMGWFFDARAGDEQRGANDECEESPASTHGGPSRGAAIEVEYTKCGIPKNPIAQKNSIRPSRKVFSIVREVR